VIAAQDQIEVFGEQRPAIDTVPFLGHVRADGEVGLAFLEELQDLARRATQELDLEPLKQPLELEQMRGRQVRGNGPRDREPQRSQLAASDGRCQRSGADRAVVALPQQRQHALAELRELRLRPLPAEQIATELALELLDRARQRRLRNVALFRGLGEIQLGSGRQKISNLMHFHRRCSKPHTWPSNTEIVIPDNSLPEKSRCGRRYLAPGRKVLSKASCQ
jgi:hypothetical protein